MGLICCCSKPPVWLTTLKTSTRIGKMTLKPFEYRKCSGIFLQNFMWCIIFCFRNRYNNAQPAHAQSVRVGHTGAVTGLDIPQERQGKVSAKIQQLLNTLKVLSNAASFNLWPVELLIILKPVFSAKNFRNLNHAICKR